MSSSTSQTGPRVALWVVLFVVILALTVPGTAESETVSFRVFAYTFVDGNRCNSCTSPAVLLQTKTETFFAGTAAEFELTHRFFKINQTTGEAVANGGAVFEYVTVGGVTRLIDRFEADEHQGQDTSFDDPPGGEVQVRLEAFPYYDKNCKFRFMTDGKIQLPVTTFPSSQGTAYRATYSVTPQNSPVLLSVYFECFSSGGGR